MTIKLLAQYGRAPAGALLTTLDAATEAALVAAGQATTNLGGGTAWTDPYSVTPAGQVAVVLDRATGVAIANDTAIAGASPLRSALFVGDSLTDYARVGLAAASITLISPGVIRVVRTSHSLSVGQYFGTTAGSADACTMRAQVTSVIDVNTFDALMVGPMHTVTGAAPSILIEDRASTRGWPTWLDSISGQPLQRTWAAIGGASMSNLIELLPRLPAGQEDMAFVCIGMNDIYSRGDSLAAMKANFVSLMALVKKRSGRICVLSVPPRNSADGAWSAGKQTIHTGFNKFLYDQCVANGWEFVNTARAKQGGAAYVNAAASNPDPTVGFTHDNTHPNMRGAKAIADEVWATVSKWFGPKGLTAAHPSAIGADVGNLLTGSDFPTDTAGVVTGWTKTSPTPNMVATFTREARTVATDGDACGSNQVMTIDIGTAGASANVRFQKSGIQALLTAGKKYYLAVPFSVTNALGLTGLELNMSGTRADGTFWFVTGNHMDSNAGTLVGNFSGWLITPVSTCPPNLTSLDIWVRPYISSAQTAGNPLVLKAWQPVLSEVP